MTAFSDELKKIWQERRISYAVRLIAGVEASLKKAVSEGIHYVLLKNVPTDFDILQRWATKNQCAVTLTDNDYIKVQWTCPHYRVF